MNRLFRASGEGTKPWQCRRPELRVSRRFKVPNGLSASQGFSLVELAVYIVLLGIIGAVVVTAIVALFRSEKTVSGITTATSESQNMTAVLQRDIRNARQFQSSGDGLTLVASVAGSGTTLNWECVRWQVTGSGDNRKVTRETKNDASGQAWGGAGALLSGVSKHGSAAFFSGSAALGSRSTATYTMRVASADGGKLDVAGIVSNTAQGAGATSFCFS